MTNLDIERRKRRLAKLVATSKTLAPAETIGMESMPTGGARPDAPRLSAVKDKIASILANMPADEVPDPGAFQRALNLTFQHGVPAYTNLIAGNTDAMSNDQIAAMEAVVEADGSRPSLLLRNGAVDLKHPLVGDWKSKLQSAAKLVSQIAPSVGRVQPEGGSGSNFFGTATVVDAKRGFVLTNWHVLEAMCKRVTTIYEYKGAGRYRFHDGVYVDFAAETNAKEDNLFKVVEGQTSNIDGQNFARLDAAVLRIEPVNKQSMPPALRVTADPRGPSGAFDSMCIISHPGRPLKNAGIETFNNKTIDWAWVNTVLFGGTDLYGLKRLSPGEIDIAVGDVGKTDPRNWTFGHDATSLGGSSGGTVVAWLDGGAMFGLHFAGATLHANYAHAISACVKRLHEIGVPIVEAKGNAEADGGAPGLGPAVEVSFGEQVVSDLDQDSHSDVGETGGPEAAAPWRVARALLKLRDQVNTMAPGRSKASDGTIGDKKHEKTKSDHNPIIDDAGTGVVAAMDITHDPKNGCDVGKVAEAIVKSRDRRVKYIIYNGRIINSTVSPWKWRPYTGVNPHTKHMHVSVQPEKETYDDQAPWRIT